MELYSFPLWCFVLSACALSMLTYTTVTADLVAQVSTYDSRPDENGHHRVKRSTSNLLCSNEQVKRHDNIASYCSVHDPTNAVTCYIPPCDPFLVPIFDLTGFSQDEAVLNVFIEHRQQVVAGITLGSPHCTDYLDISDMFEPVFFPARQSVAGMYLVLLETKYEILNIPLNIFIDESLSPGTPCNDRRGLETTTLVPPTRSQSSYPVTFNKESSTIEEPTTDPKNGNNGDEGRRVANKVISLFVIMLIIVIVLSIILGIAYSKYAKLKRACGLQMKKQSEETSQDPSESVGGPFIH